MTRMGLSLLFCLCTLTACGSDTGLNQRFQAERALWNAQREARRISIQPSLVDQEQWQELAARFEAIAADNATVQPGDTDRPSGKLSTEVRAISARALISAAEVYAGLGDTARTMAVYDRIRKEFTDVPEATSMVAMAQGRIAESQQDWLTAANAYQTVVETIEPSPGDPGLPGVVMELPLRVVRLKWRLTPDASLATRKPLYDGARSYYEGIIEANPASSLEAMARIYLAEVASDLGAWDEALGELVQAEKNVLALDLPPRDPADVRFGIAMIQSRMSNSDEPSQGTFESLLKDYPESPAAPRSLMALHSLALRAGDIEKSIEYLDRLRADYSANENLAAQALLAKARILEKNDRWEEALKIYRALPVEHPISEAALQAPLEIVNHYSRTEDAPAVSNELQRAEESYREFLSRYPAGEATVSARQKLIQTLSLQERYREAVQELVDLGDAVSPSPAGARFLIRAAQLTYIELADTTGAADILEHTGTLFSNVEIGRWAASESERIRGELAQ